MRFKVQKSDEIIDVLLLRHKGTETWSYVNLTKGHICPCVFSSIREALADMENKMKNGDIINYWGV